ncbi:iron-sulfur cluster repair di-iron protein [Caulobacter segnis]|uniref:Iron-sulfur cluster repair di-iron protein n=2 Tax=Caulobacter segnis TaxID=88688 RepID=D5VLV8_CAUST|nr:iron-sulfur cluster repair di-iron protein [Caulobacter segnis]ADG11481.1 iron-sulfur cluster repair di-iron protein [Caulobacter segnis ATCC 21756]AVQ03140.1 iron-sulfur cluster repair di-iron protein [Caulobacter segnis]MDR6626911.1 regulator of cell morphogenesis and NO signaling [Caulobacter segnis]
MDITTAPPLLDQPVRDIAIGRPGSTAIFRRHKIDYCRGGGTPLAKAAEERGIDLAGLIAQLDALDRAEAAAPADTEALIDHLLDRYHEVHRRQFPEAIFLAARVESVHGDRPDCPTGIAQHLAFMFDDLEAHHQKEEMILFPMMRRGELRLGAPISRMEAEHDDVVEQLKGLARLTNDFTPPENACGTWRALYALCHEIDADLRDHMHLENNVLFRRFG